MNKFKIATRLVILIQIGIVFILMDIKKLMTSAEMGLIAVSTH